MPNGWEWAVLVVIALLLFAGARLSGVGRNVGSSIREFKQEVGSGTAVPTLDEEPPTIAAEPVEAVAGGEVLPSESQDSEEPADEAGDPKQESV